MQCLRGTPFQQNVGEALLAIPLGKMRSYGELATRLGKPRASGAKEVRTEPCRTSSRLDSQGRIRAAQSITHNENPLREGECRGWTT
ncbi:MAG: MGMT family protein [Acidobacteriaceae bacterium]